MKRLFLLVALIGLARVVQAQFEVGLAGGGYLYKLTASDPDGSPHITSDQTFPLNACLSYRDRRASVANFFAELDWRHREFTAHLDEGGHGGGTRSVWDTRLDHLYFTVGPEYGRKSLTVRVGLQLGWVIGGSMEGTTSSWSIYPPPEGNWSKDTIPDQRPDRFRGDQRLLFAFRYTRALGESWNLSFDPFMSLSLSSMLASSDNQIRGFDLGLRIGVMRYRNGRGFWTRLRAGPLRVQMKEPKPNDR